MNPRAVAAQLIATVVCKHQSLNLALAQQTTDENQSLVQAMAFGVCRWYLQLDAIAMHLLNKPIKQKDYIVHALILVGLYQLKFMRIPEHAAVAETVAATKDLKKPWAKAVVNAVLRNYQRHSEELDAVIMQHESSQYTHPTWLIEVIKLAWPQQWQQILTENNKHPPMCLRVNLQRLSRDDYLQLLLEASLAAIPGKYAASAIYLDQPVAVSKLPKFAEGWVSVQDEAAQLAAGLMQLAPGLRVLDACAAPGGKTAHLLESQTDLAQVVALEQHPPRVELIADTLQRLGLSATVQCADAADTKAWWDGQAFDRILIDAPCSATGVIRRHPDIKLLRQAADIKTIMLQQQHLLKALWPVLKPGGLLLYATCSILPEENTEMISKFITEQNDAKVLPIAAEWGKATAMGRQILPSQQGMDGFFYSVLQKV